MKPRIIVCLSLLASIFLAGCSGSSADKVLNKERRQSAGNLDTVEFHVFRGDEAVKLGEYAKAENSYRKALEINPANVAALSGLAGAMALKSSQENLSDAQKAEMGKRSQVYLDAAAKVMSGNAEKERYYNGVIVVNSALQVDPNWYQKARDAFEKAQSSGSGSHSAKYFMAKAHASNGKYEASEKLFRSVINDNGFYSEQADAELVKIHKIQRAKPGTRFGMNIAVSEKVTRAEMAALLITEFNLSTLYKQKISAYNQKYLPPESQQALETTITSKVPDAIDIVGHPHKGDIEEILDLKLRGLEADPAHKFYPDQAVFRSEFALLVEDLLIKITGDNRLKTKYIGESSPYRDVRGDIFYYNAVRVAVERNLLELTNKITSEFSPDQPINGADAILAIRELRKAVESVLRS